MYTVKNVIKSEPYIPFVLNKFKDKFLLLDFIRDIWFRISYLILPFFLQCIPIQYICLLSCLRQCANYRTVIAGLLRTSKCAVIYIYYIYIYIYISASTPLAQHLL